MPSILGSYTVSQETYLRRTDPTSESLKNEASFHRYLWGSFLKSYPRDLARLESGMHCVIRREKKIAMRT